MPQSQPRKVKLSDIEIVLEEIEKWTLAARSELKKYREAGGTDVELASGYKESTAARKGGLGKDC
jgi:hypothetical protein